MSFIAKRLLATAMLISCTGLIAVSQAPEKGSDNAKVIEVHARRFEFSPAEITVVRGQPVQLKLISDDVPHSLLVKDLGINQVVTHSKPAIANFTPSKEGTFVGQCGRFCGAGHGKMKFTVHVTGN